MRFKRAIQIFRVQVIEVLLHCQNTVENVVSLGFRLPPTRRDSKICQTAIGLHVPANIMISLPAAYAFIKTVQLTKLLLHLFSPLIIRL